MEDSDIQAVVQLEREIFPDPWPSSSFEEVIADSIWSVLVMEEGPEIIAYACWLIVDAEAHLTNIAVAKEHRRKSVAQRILEHILDNVTTVGCEYVLLEVRPSNKTAIAFYYKHDFKFKYTRPNYYRQPPEDAMVMVRYLHKK